MRCTPASPAEASGSADILAIVSDRGQPFLPAALAECPGADLAKLAMCLGMFRTRWQGPRHIETLIGRGPSGIAAVVIAGVEAVRDWPRTFEAHLAAEAGTASRRAGRYGARKALGPSYDWARDLENGPTKDAVLEVMRRSIGGDELAAHRVHRSQMLAGLPRSGATVTLAEARTVLGLSHPSVRKLILQGRLACTGDEGRGVPSAIRRRDVDLMAAAAAKSLTLDDAARLLAVTPARVRRLLYAGLIKGTKVPFSPWSIPVASVRGLLERLEARVAAEWFPGQSMLFERALRILGKRGHDFASVVAMAADGRLRVTSAVQSARGLKRFQIEVGVKQPLAEAGVTIKVMAARLGLKWEVAAHLVARGLVDLGPDGADVFRATYVSGVELARTRGISPKSLLALIAAEGHAPITGPSVDGGRQYFYRRVETAVR